MKLFLSHKGRDKGTARTFKDALPQFLETWLDEESLTWGQHLAAKLKKAIDSEVDFVIIFLSHDTLDSQWVKRELGWALQREKKLDREFLLPIILGDKRAKNIPEEVSSRLYLECDYSERSIESVADQAAMHLFRLLIEQHEKLSKNTLAEVVRQARTGRYHAKDVWCRAMLKRPLKSSILDNAKKVLKSAVSNAGETLCEIMPTADAPRVRANIFLPTTDNIQNGDVCTLAIVEVSRSPEKYLQVNMKDPIEIRIPFRPNEGATGTVFVQQKAVGVVVNPKWLDGDEPTRRELKEEKWIYVELNPSEDLSTPGDSLYTKSGKNDFNMSDFLERRVAKDLTWIVSMPIFVAIDGCQEVVGVLNVDCREYWIEPKHLRAIFYRIAPLAGVLSGIFQGLPVDNIAITRAET